MTARMPAIFSGHGNPMNTLLANAHTMAWRAHPIEPHESGQDDPIAFRAARVDGGSVSMLTVRLG